MHRVLITGGGGFIGSALAKALLCRGLEVTVLGRSAYPALEKMGIRCLRGDIRDAACTFRALEGQDTVFHVAAKAGIWGPAREYFSINFDGTRNVLAACRQNRVRACVYTSTPSVVFNRQDLAGQDESLPYASRPLCPYAASKILAEKAVLAIHGPDLRTIALRPHLVWGPGDRHLIPRLLTRGREQALKIVGSGTNRVDISYIDNVVQAHLLAAENLWEKATGGGQAFFIGQEKPVVLWPWINGLFARMGIPPVRRKIPFALAYGIGAGLELIHSLKCGDAEPRMTRFLACQLARSHWFSHQRAETLLGYRPLVSTEEGLERLAAWLQESGDAPQSRVY